MQARWRVVALRKRAPYHLACVHNSCQEPAAALSGDSSGGESTLAQDALQAVYPGTGIQAVHPGLLHRRQRGWVSWPCKHHASEQVPEGIYAIREISPASL